MLVAMDVIKQLYTRYQMSPSLAFELMSPFRGKGKISLEEWVTVLEEVATLGKPQSSEPTESPPDSHHKDDFENPEYSPEVLEVSEDLRPDLASSGGLSRDSGYDFPSLHLTRKSLTDSLRDIQLSHAKSSALRDKQKWMELARNDFMGLHHADRKSSLAQIFSDIDYELYPEDIACMGLSESNRTVLAEELKKMAQVNKALRRR